MTVLFPKNEAPVCLQSSTIPATPFSFPPEKYTFLWTLLALSYFWILVCLWVFVRFKKRFDHLRLRRTSLVLVTCLAACAYLNVAVLGPILEPGYPCIFNLLDSVFIVPLAGAAFLTRFYVLYFLSLFSTMVVQKPDNHDAVAAKLAAHAAPVRIKRLTVLQAAKMVVLRVFVHPERPVTSDVERRQLLWVVKFMVGNLGLVWIFAFLLIPYVVIFLLSAFSDPAYFAGCTGCQNGNELNFAVQLAVTILVFLMGVHANWITRGCVDKFGLGREGRWLLFCYFFALIGYILTIFDPRTDQAYDHNFVFGLGMLGAVTVSTIVQVVIARRNEGPRVNRLQPEGEHSRGGGGTVPTAATLDRIMGTPALSTAFEKHLRHEFSVESLFFLRDVQAWKATYFDIGQTARVARARRMLHQYIKSAGTYTINIDFKLQSEIFAALPDDAADVHREFLDSAAEEIRKLLLRGSVVRFLKSDAFEELAAATSMPESGHASSTVSKPGEHDLIAYAEGRV